MKLYFQQLKCKNLCNLDDDMKMWSTQKRKLYKRIVMVLTVHLLVIIKNLKI